MNISEPGWIHEDDNGDQGCYPTPHEALVGFLRHIRGSCDDDTDERELELLDNTEQRVIYMEERVLASEEQREAELVGMDDEESMIEMPIGGKYFRETKSVRYLVLIDHHGDEQAGTLAISYARKQK